MTDLVDYLAAMAKQGASDVYFIPGAPVQMKVEGVTHPVANTEMNAESVKSLAYGVMNDKQKRDLEANVDLIQQGEFESIRDIMAQSTDQGMMTFESSVFEAFMAGKVSREEALRNVDSKGNLQTRIRLARQGFEGEGNLEMKDETLR